METHDSVEPSWDSAADCPVYFSEGLLKGHREIIIQHGEERYRLRHTNKGKLILTK